MTDTLPFLKSLISTSGLSGYEAPVRKLIEDAWRTVSDELHISRLGSLQAVRRGSAPWSGAGQRPSLLLACHMDAIGLMVNGIVDGFLRITRIGGLDPRVLPGQLVTVHGGRDLPGVIVQPPAFLLPDRLQDKPVPLEYLWIDTGLPPDEVAGLVRLGNLVSFAQPPIELSDDLLVGHSLDNRASVAAVTHCLQELQNRQLEWDVWAVSTVQEEESLLGAFTSAYVLRPALAVAIDVTFGASPGSPSHATFPLQKGLTLAWGPNIHPGLFRAFEALADRLEIPYKLEATPHHSGTDAYGLQVAAEGVPTMVVGIPLRYMHTPVEMVSIKDIQRAGRLLAEFTAGLDASFMQTLSWDDEG